MAERKLTVRNLQNELKRRDKQKSFKGDKYDIKEQEEYIKSLKSENNRRRYKVKKLKLEQIKKGTSKERVREIDKELKKADYQPIPLKSEQNYLNMLKGKDFYHVIDDGFQKYAIKHSKLIKMDNFPLYAVTKMIENIEEAEATILQRLKNKKIPASERQKLRGTLKGLRKIHKIAKENESALEKKSFKKLEGFERGDDRYILLALILGETIRINA